MLVFDRVSKSSNVAVGNIVISAGSLGKGALPSMFPRGLRIGTVSSVSNNDVDTFKTIQVDPFVDFSSLQSVIVLVPRQGRRLMDGIKAAGVLFLAALLQLSVLTEYRAIRTSSIVLVALLSVALLRGSVFGALAGFGTGLMLDTATLGTLGVTSLLMTVGGFWIGRYGETTARDRFHAPYVSVAVVTVLYALGQLFLQFVLGEPAPAGVVVHALPLGLLLNLLLTLPVYGLVRRLFPPQQLGDRVREVRLLG